MTDSEMVERNKSGHLFQFGKCIYCGVPIDFIPGVMFWRGGYILPDKIPLCEAAQAVREQEKGEGDGA